MSQDISIHLPPDCLFSKMFVGWHQRKHLNSPSLALCDVSPPVIGGFPSQRTSNAVINRATYRYQYHSCIMIINRYGYHTCIVIIWQSKPCLIRLNKNVLHIRRDIIYFTGVCSGLYLSLWVVFIVKWNIKHNINESQNTYISLNHSIFPY